MLPLTLLSLAFTMRAPPPLAVHHGRSLSPVQRGVVPLAERPCLRPRCGSVRMEEDGRIVTGQSADTDTVVASARAYVHALNRLLVRRDKTGGDAREISYKDVS